MTAASPSWWHAWQPRVFVTIASGHQPAAALPADCTREHACIQLLDGAGATLDATRHAAVIVADACPGDDVCVNDTCDTIRMRTGVRDLHAVVLVP
jgi:hypothetical protein